MSHNKATKKSRVTPSSMKASILAELQDDKIPFDIPETPRLTNVKLFESQPLPHNPSPKTALPEFPPRRADVLQGPVIPPLLVKLWAQQSKQRHTWWQTPKVAWNSRVYGAPAWEDPLPTLDTLIHALPAEELQERRPRPSAARVSQQVVKQRDGPKLNLQPRTISDPVQTKQGKLKGEKKQDLRHHQQQAKTTKGTGHTFEQIAEAVKKLEVLKAEYDRIGDEEAIENEEVD